MGSVALEIAIILLLILVNGVFAMAELAIVSARKARLQQRADKGDAGASAALALANEPGNFMSTVQIGITLVGVLAGAFGGATIARELAQGLQNLPLLAPYSEAVSVALVVLGITYLTLVLGELAPKQIALNDRERVAAAVAPTMRGLSRIAAPLARLLSLSADGVLRILGIRPSAAPPVTEEEIKIMIEQGTRIGVFDPVEEEMVDHVFRLGDRRVSAITTPRRDILWLDVNDPPQEIQRKVVVSGYSRFPVADGSLDNLVGLALAKDLLVQSLDGEPLDLRAALRPAALVPEAMPALDVLERFREARSKIAMVVDEYGGVLGLVTAADILEAIVGDIPGLGEEDEPEVVQRADGSWLLDGMLPLDEFGEVVGLGAVSVPGIDTLGGLVMASLGRIPTAGDRFEWKGLALEVVDMDGHRVDKVLVMPLAASAQDHNQTPDRSRTGSAPDGP
jgi:putative hemolysin